MMQHLIPNGINFRFALSYYYLVVGHACDEEQESHSMFFEDKQPTAYLENEFIRRVRLDWEYDEDKEIYVDFIFKSNNPIEVQYG